MKVLEHSTTFVNGLQRSGTNFARSIYTGSLEYAHPYWKHDLKLPKEEPNCEKVVCIIKNPYSWVESICFRNAVDIAKMFPEKSLIDPKDCLGPNSINLKRLLELYKLFYTGWMDYDKTELVHYESLLNKYTRDKVPYSADWHRSNRRSYLRYDTPLLPSEAIHIITKELTPEFFKRIGYPIK